MVCRTKNLTRL